MRHFDQLTSHGQVRRLYAMGRAAMKRYGLVATRLQLLQNEKGAVLKVRALETKGTSRALRRTAGAFVLRIYRDPAISNRMIRAQAQWLRAILDETDLVVPEPIADHHGDHVVDLAAPDFGDSVRCSVMRWVPGKPRLLKTGPGAEALRQVGQLMAKLHLHGQRFSPELGAEFPRYDCEGLFGACSCYWPKDGLDAVDAGKRRILEHATQRMREAMNEVGNGPEDFGLIHGDLIQVNYIFYRGQVRAIDFGDCGYGHYLYDMGVTLLMLYAFDADGSQRTAFLEGYRQVRPLSAAHERLLDVFIAGRAVALIRWTLGNENLRTPGGVSWASGAIGWVRQWLACQGPSRRRT